MSQNQRSDDVDNGSRRNKESEHESTTVSASRSLEQEEVLLSREFRHIIARILEPLVTSPNSQFEHSNLGSQTYNSGSEDGSRPVSALMKVIEVMVIRTVQHSITPVIEGLFRRVAKEVIEAEVEKILTRNSGIEMHSLTKSLELRFCDKISLPVWTGSRIEGEGHKPLELALRDTETGQVVDSGPEASTEFEVFLLQRDIERNATRECKGKNSLLKGNTNLKLNKGIGCLGGISFKHKSNWTKKCELRLGARIVDPLIGTRVKEAKTEPFTLNDKRATLNEKHDCPSPSDPVWRLKNIDRRGVYCQKLGEKGITTVQEFLTEYKSNPQGLQNILGSRMLSETVANAMKCKLDDSIFHCSPSSQQADGDFVGQLLGVHSEGVPVDQLHQMEKAGTQEMVVCAFKHCEEVSYLEKNFLGCDSSDISNALCFSHSHRPESTSGHNSENYHMINETDGTQPHNSLPDIISSNNPALVGPSNGGFNTTDGCDSNRSDANIIEPHSSDLGITEDDIFQQHTSFMGSMCNSLMGPFDSFEFPDLDFQMDSTCNSSMGPLDSFEFPNLDFQTLNVQLDYFGDQGNKTGMETPADQPSAECPSVNVSAQAVAVGKVPRRWMRASMVLIVELIKRNVKSNDPKRQRCS